MVRCIYMKKSKLRLIQAGVILAIVLGLGLIYYKFRPKADTGTVTAKAFPTAEGFGAQSQGGRGGQVIEVTNLLDRVLDTKGRLVVAPGSLRSAIQTKGPRTIVFRVSGTIDLGRSTIEVNEPYLTIAGQTAPGDGITIKNGFIRVTTNDVVIRHIRIRPGPGGYPSQRPDGNSADVLQLGTNNGHTASNVVLDHVSLSWGTDEILDIGNSAHNITLQQSILSEAMSCVPPPFWHDAVEKCHSKSTLLYRGATDITFSHNLFAHAIDRNPLIMSGDVQFVNNVNYNYGGPLYVIPRFSPVRVDIIGNAYRAGVDSLPGRPSKHEIRLHDMCANNGATCFGEESSAYINDNLGTDTPTGAFRDARTLCPDSSTGGCLMYLPSRPIFSGLTIEPAETAYTHVLASAGAIRPKRDAVDERVVNSVKNGTGSIINEPSEVGGWPDLQSAPAPTDSDHDGMPDDWETKHGLNTSESLDRNDDGTGDGYTNVEKYLNELAGDIDYGSAHFTITPHDNPTPTPSPEITPTVPPPVDQPTPSPTLDPTPAPTPTPSATVDDTGGDEGEAGGDDENLNVSPDPEPTPATSLSPEATTAAAAQATAATGSRPSPQPTHSASTVKPKVAVLPKLLETSQTAISPEPGNSLRPLVLIEPSPTATKRTNSQTKPTNAFGAFFQTIFAQILSLFGR
jgi:pectate lyase